MRLATLLPLALLGACGETITVSELERGRYRNPVSAAPNKISSHRSRIHDFLASHSGRFCFVRSLEVMADDDSIIYTLLFRDGVNRRPI